MRLRGHLLNASKILTKAGAESPGLSARLLLAHVLGIDKTRLALLGEDSLKKGLADKFYALVGLYGEGIPMAHLLETKEFYDSVFITGKQALVPRPETELVVELALARAPRPDTAFADLGCGTGCIGLSILKERPAWSCILLELSIPALALAAANALNLAPGAAIVRGDIFNLPFRQQSLDMIVANPPYIAWNELAVASPHVLRHEPHCALFSEDGGLAHIKSIARQARHILRAGGCLILEHGAGQKDRVLDILLDNCFINCEDYPDLAGLPRCALGWKQ